MAQLTPEQQIAVEEFQCLRSVEPFAICGYYALLAMVLNVRAAE